MRSGSWTSWGPAALGVQVETLSVLPALEKEIMYFWQKCRFHFLLHTHFDHGRTVVKPSFRRVAVLWPFSWGREGVCQNWMRAADAEHRNVTSSMLESLLWL